MSHVLRLLLGIGLFVLLEITCRAEAPKLTQTSRVVLLGNTLIEREQRDAYWETELTRLLPTAVPVRNLGWSGDTVFGHARAGFGSVPDGFRNMQQHVLAVKPTHIVLAFGSVEAFEGEAGLDAFVKGYETLLDALAKTQAHLMLVTPLPQEKLPTPLPDPAEQNRKLALYRKAILDLGSKRKLPVLDLFQLASKDRLDLKDRLVTDNGLHLTAFGYWQSAPHLARFLGSSSAAWQVQIDAKSRKATATGTSIDLAKESLRWQCADKTLPRPVLGNDAEPRTVQITGLEPGTYQLTIDKEPVQSATADDWAKGVQLKAGPEYAQVEQLRVAIREKNREYFHRWRPQNETYLFGFRKHEQGQNAKEVAEFEKIVEKIELHIAQLRVPKPHEYELRKK